LRGAYNANLPKISQYWTEFGQNPALFEKYRSLRASPEFARLSRARRKIVDNALRDFRLGGAELPPEATARFAAIQEAPTRLRETMYRESVTRASEFGRPEWDNTPLIARIVALRGELARLLGYRSYAEVSLVPKMAESPEQVLRFLDDLARRARPFAERDAEELREFAKTELGIAPLEAWDLAYAAEKLRAKRYAFSDQELKRYFPEDAAIAGLFRVAETLYGITIAPARAAAWPGGLRFFELRNSAGALLGQFYADLYARDTNRGAAWMD